MKKKEKKDVFCPSFLFSYIHSFLVSYISSFPPFSFPTSFVCFLLSFFPSVHQSIFPSFCLSIHPYPSINPFVLPSFHPSIHRCGLDLCKLRSSPVDSSLSPHQTWTPPCWKHFKYRNNFIVSFVYVKQRLLPPDWFAPCVRQAAEPLRVVLRWWRQDASLAFRPRLGPPPPLHAQLPWQRRGGVTCPEATNQRPARPLALTGGTTTTKRLLCRSGDLISRLL